MLGLGWQYRWGCLRLLVLQGLLLLTALGTLRLTGLGIDLIRWHARAADKPPPASAGPCLCRRLGRRWRKWPLIAGLILVLELIRGIAELHLCPLGRLSGSHADRARPAEPGV